MMKNTFLSLALLPLLASAACKKSESSTAKAVAFDEAGVNALVPADLKDKLAFEKRDIVEERGRKTVTYTMVAPKDWEQKMKGFGTLEPKMDLGFMTRLSIGSNCDGMCKPKNWAETAEKVNFGQFKDGKILEDKVTKTSRLMIAEQGDSTYVTYAWWSDGASRYHTCTASLEAPVRAAAPAFAKACEAVAIRGEN